MPQEKPKKKKPLSNTPAGLGAKLGSAVRESFPLAASPAALGAAHGAALGAKVKGYMDSKKKKNSSKYIKYLDDSDKKKELERIRKYGAPKGYGRQKSDKG